MTPSWPGPHEDPFMNTENFKNPLLAGGPFRLENEDSYRRWRDWKLNSQPASARDLVVEVEDPVALSAAERDALLALPDYVLSRDR